GSAHQQRACEPGTFGVADALQILSPFPRLFQHRAGQRDQAPDMVPGGELRDDPAVGLVHGDLGMDRLGEQPPVVERYAGLVAGSLDTEDEHQGDSDTIRTPFRNPEKKLDANSTREGKRAVRGGDAPLQAHRGEDRPPDRAPFPRVLRKADRGAQAQACRRREAPSQAPAQPDAAAEAVLAIPLKQQITEDMKAAMRAKDTARLSTVRLLLAAIKQREVDERIELD